MSKILHLQNCIDQGLKKILGIKFYLIAELTNDSILLKMVHDFIVYPALYKHKRTWEISQKCPSWTLQWKHQKAVKKTDDAE